VRKFQSDSYDYVSNCHPPTFPCGMPVEVFSWETLEKLRDCSRLFSEKEHVTPYVYNNPELFKMDNIEHDRDLSPIRVVLDYEDDAKLLNMLAEHLDLESCCLDDIVNLYDRNRYLFNVNVHDIREGYIKSCAKDTVIHERQ